MEKPVFNKKRSAKQGKKLHMPVSIRNKPYDELTEDELKLSRDVRRAPNKESKVYHNAFCPVEAVLENFPDADLSGLPDEVGHRWGIGNRLVRNYRRRNGLNVKTGEKL